MAEANPSTLEPSRQYPDALRLPYEGPVPPWKWPGLRVGPFPNKKRGLGSSDATVILGESKYKSALGLYWEIRGEIPKPPTAFPELAEMGILLEPIIMELYRRRTRRTLIDRADYPARGGRWDVRAHPDHPWLLANLDMEATIGDGDKLPFEEPSLYGVVEGKSKDAWGEYFDEDGNPTREVIVQVQHQMLVTGYKWASICFLVGRRFYTVDVRAHEPFQRYMLGELAEFWERCWNGDPPPPDSSKATSDAILAKYPVESEGRIVTFTEQTSKRIPRLLELKEQMKGEKEEVDQIENFVKLEMGDAEEATDLWRRQGFSYLKANDGAAKWEVPAPLDEKEEKIVAGLGGKLKAGKKGGRTLRARKAENIGKRKRK